MSPRGFTTWDRDDVQRPRRRRAPPGQGALSFDAPQPPEVPWPAAARRDDPSTSQRAADAITASGKRQTHAGMVLAAVIAEPGLAAHVYGERTGLGHVAAQRRLSDLARFEPPRGPLVRTGDEVQHGGHRVVSWHPTALALAGNRP